MAGIMKRVTEGIRQKMGVEEEHGRGRFKPVPNVRNPAMMQEAEDFAKVMVKYKTALQLYAAKIDKYLEMHPAVFQRNLPRVWSAPEGHPGQCEPGRSPLSTNHPTRVGGDCDIDMLVESRLILRKRIEGIVRPIDHWLASLGVVRTRMAKLASLKLTVDARRRTIIRNFQDTLEDMERQRSTSEGEGGADSAASHATWAGNEDVSAPGMGGGPPPASELLDSSKQMTAQHKQRKLDAVTATYKEQEALVHEQLSGLVVDSAYFKSYMAASMLVIKEALQSSLCGLGPCHLPLPGYSLEASGVTSYGTVDIVDNMIAAVPESLKEPKPENGASSVSSKRGTGAVHANVRAAHPLQVASSGSTPRYDPADAAPLAGASSSAAKGALADEPAGDPSPVPKGKGR
ncbi:hypothetical protein FOA52_009262 [Chlamydomonas sp. UWO 241]|nr:hypothetical protein FOA52_009262 [Chlamydomonas sp. UWO 241]